MNERANCTACVHRRALTTAIPDYCVCHYLLDNGEARGCPPAECTHWQLDPKSTGHWTKLLLRIKEVDVLG